MKSGICSEQHSDRDPSPVRPPAEYEFMIASSQAGTALSSHHGKRQVARDARIGILFSIASAILSILALGLAGLRRPGFGSAAASRMASSWVRAAGLLLKYFRLASFTPKVPRPQWAMFRYVSHHDPFGPERRHEISKRHGRSGEMFVSGTQSVSGIAPRSFCATITGVTGGSTKRKTMIARSKLARRPKARPTERLSQKRQPLIFSGTTIYVYRNARRHPKSSASLSLQNHRSPLLSSILVRA